MLGQSTFPLKEKWSLCIGENIRDISTNGNGKVFVKTNTSLSIYDQDTGSLAWTSSIKSQGESFPPIAVGERVFVSDSEQLWAFDLKTGRTLWKSVLDSSNPENANTWVPDASEKYVLLNSISDHVYVYDAASGNKLWETQGGRGYTQAYIDNDKVYIVDRGIKAFDALTGKLLWRLDHNRVTGVSAFGNGVIYYIEHPGNETFDLVAYRAKTRSELWRISFTDNDGPVTTSPVGLYIHDNLLFMTQLGFIYRINPENGSVNWKKESSSPEDLSIIGKNIYVLNPFDGIIHALDIESGADLASLQISFYKIIGIHLSRMESTGTNLIFTRGCEVFVYGN
jgi:outer membrane protein assembly factor BamB